MAALDYLWRNRAACLGTAHTLCGLIGSLRPAFGVIEDDGVDTDGSFI